MARVSAGRSVYEVVPRNEGWAVKKRMGAQASSTHRKKSAAIRNAKRLAKKNKPSQVVIKGRNGQITAVPRNLWIL